MAIEGLICLTAYLTEDVEDTREALSTYISDPEESIEDANQNRLLEDGVPTSRGLVVAYQFSQEANIQIKGLSHAEEEFCEIVRNIGIAKEQGEPLGESDLPEGFSETEPTLSKYDKHYYTMNMSNEYSDTEEIEVNYRSRDPSGPFEMKPDKSSVSVWLRIDGEDKYQHQAGWTENI